MANTKLEQLAGLGQSIWLDYISRGLLESGQLADYIDLGLRGLTSNPAIFAKAISNSTDYDPEIQQLGVENKPVGEIYESLVVADIQRAADLLRPVYERTGGVDGFVSLEVNPHLAHDTQGTIAEVHHFVRRVDRPNLMVKVPATSEGLIAIQTLVAAGININVTLIFSVTQYDLVAEAYLSGLEQLAKTTGDLSGVHSVASIFVSRMDTKVDQQLEVLGTPLAQELKGKIGITSAKIAYQHFKDKFNGEAWEKLARQGARAQRVLYGSTSTKNPAYPDTLYVDNLIGAHTVNTVPPETLEAFLDHGTVTPTLEQDLDQARIRLEQLAGLSIDLNDITRQLLDEGVKKFADPYDQVIENIAEKKGEMITG